MKKRIGGSHCTVIPAKAGIHLILKRCGKAKMDPGFRRDDGLGGYDSASAALNRTNE